MVVELLERLDSLADEVELGFQSWEKEFEQTVHLFRCCEDTLNTLPRIQLVKSSKLLTVSSSFPDLEDKLRFTETLELERQLRLLKEKIQSLKEQENNVNSLIRKHLAVFLQDTARNESDLLFSGLSDQVTPLEYFTYLDYISRSIRSQTSRIEELCFNSRLFTSQDSVLSSDSHELEMFLEQSSLQRSEAKDWFLKLLRLREVRETWKVFQQ